MKVLAVTQDRNCLGTISLALQLRWPGADILKVLSEDEASGADPSGFDLVIVDGSSDGAATALIKKLRGHSSVPLLLISDARGDLKETAQALIGGADDYVFKPLDALELVSRMEALIQTASASPEEP